MELTEILTRLRAYESEMRGHGVTQLSVFGSAARGEVGPKSDVDLAARFDQSRHLGLMAIGRIERRLGEILETDVDLVSEHPHQKPRFQAELQRDRVVAF